MLRAPNGNAVVRIEGPNGADLLGLWGGTAAPQQGPPWAVFGAVVAAAFVVGRSTRGDGFVSGRSQSPPPKYRWCHNCVESTLAKPISMKNRVFGAFGDEYFSNCRRTRAGSK